MRWSVRIDSACTSELVTGSPWGGCSLVRICFLAGDQSNLTPASKQKDRLLENHALAEHDGFTTTQEGRRMRARTHDRLDNREIHLAIDDRGDLGTVQVLLCMIAHASSLVTGKT